MIWWILGGAVYVVMGAAIIGFLEGLLGAIEDDESRVFIVLLWPVAMALLLVAAIVCSLHDLHNITKKLGQRWAR